MKKKSNKQLYGLIGYPVQHSYSARMHNAAFRYFHINAEYRLFEVKPEQLEDFLSRNKPFSDVDGNSVDIKNISGFNVTVPHKEKVYAYLAAAKAEILAGAQRIRAVNTVIVNPDGSLRGANTDGSGFVEDLEEHKIIFDKDTNIALIGAGGGAKAVAMEMNLSWPSFFIFDADKNKAQQLSRMIMDDGGKAAVADSVEDLRIPEADILINAIPLGMRDADPLLVKKEWLHKNLFVYDLIYNPLETKLLKTAKEAGCKCANGLGMLLYQGCLAFTHWTHKEAPVEVMRRALSGRMDG